MPGVLQTGQKRPAAVVTGEDGGQQSHYSSSASVDSKRARLARDASESLTQANDRGDSDHSQIRNGDAIQAFAEDSFRAGSIVRVKLKNFVTYTAAEFHLGPSLNMVIGPNGTGKSTLVCAICLGLGWASEHLGRAKEIGLFVKNGSTEAEIEIELAAGAGRDANPVVRRLIRKTDNKSIFWINGKLSSKNAVLALCKEYSIQIDNLCQFLPQDRVVEFAKMSDVDRLRETQRAAAPPQMVEWHDQLKALRTEEKKFETEQQNHQRHLEGLEKAQNAAREDVNRWQQRQGLLQKSKCLKKVRPIIEINLRRVELEQAKEVRRAAKQEFDQIKADVEPVRLAQAEAETYRDQIDQVVKLRKNRVESMKTKADKIIVEIDEKQQAVTDLATDVSAEVAAKRERERDIARTTADIAKLERQRQEHPVDYDAAAFSQRLKDLRSQITALGESLADKQLARNDLTSRIRSLVIEERNVQGLRQQLDTQSGKQASMLGKVSGDTAIAWNWFQENKAGLPLKGEVYGPSILECSIRDPRYAQVVENQLRRGDFIAITCTNGDDQRLLSDRFLSKAENNGLGLHDIHMRTSPKPLSSYRPPVAHADLSRFGFEGYVIDYIQGPDPVLAMLCDNAQVNKIAYASKPITDEQHNAASNSPIQKWVSGKSINAITTRREYNASSTAVTQLKPAKYFVDQPVNTEEKRRLEEKITNIGRDYAELKELLRINIEEMSAIDSQIKELKTKKVRLSCTRNGIY
jgi:DNA repair ATPase RecN